MKAEGENGTEWNTFSGEFPKQNEADLRDVNALYNYYKLLTLNMLYNIKQGAKGGPSVAFEPLFTQTGCSTTVVRGFWVGKGKDQQDYRADCRCAHAASSSGRFQSLPRAVNK